MGDSEEPAAINIAKRLIVCCDGTWMNSDNGYIEPGLFSDQGSLQIPSNVTRISRCFKRRCKDGKLQIVSYETGVGTGSNFVDTITGGAFGLGLSERVREAYSYLCANYADGDEIFLVGFSRGAFTARSVAGLVANLGLLTREGIEHFYPIFKDMQNWENDEHEDQFPNNPFPDKPKGARAADEYRTRLEKLGYTRVTQKSGELIKIKGVCVWDTVGSLGIPKIAWLSKVGVTPDNEDTYKWHDTALTDRIEHGFQALALDEHRPPFSPAVWERPKQYRTTTELRQVWFPGNHANIGGGWADQGVANCSLAWMMDQMASVGVEFDQKALERVFQQSIDYYRSLHKAEQAKQKKAKKNPLLWAVNPIYQNNHPQRPWGLGAIKKNGSLFYKLAGQVHRTPGLYKKQNPKTDKDEKDFLEDTNERVHSSVRIRLACQGLGLNDTAVWEAPSLTKRWKLTRTTEKIVDPVPMHPSWDPDVSNPAQNGADGKGRWVWEYNGDDGAGPTDSRQRTLVEEPLGPYERFYVKMAGGTPNVFDFADNSGH